MESIIFSPYSEYELQQILLARVGSTVIAPNVIDYISKKVASSTGDARKALEMAAYAVQHRIDQSTSSTASDLTNGHLVKMPNVIQGNKEEVLNLKERISGQPVVGKVILCVLTSYAQASGAVDTTIGELKQCVSECMRQTGIEDEMVQMEDFLVLLETLVDSGLLRASSTESYNKRNGMNLSRRTLSDVHRQPIRLGIQLEDIEKVLDSELKQSFYQNLRDRAKVRRQDEQ
jgi:Cdc6-like AAA superfamily ATPase